MIIHLLLIIIRAVVGPLPCFGDVKELPENPEETDMGKEGGQTHVCTHLHPSALPVVHAYC